jgi:hypothetical protein
MKKVILASALFLTVAGASMAQQTPKKDSTKTEQKAPSKSHHTKHHSKTTTDKKS